MNVRAVHRKFNKDHEPVVHMGGKNFPFIYRAYCGTTFVSFEETTDQATCERCLARLAKEWVA